MALSLFNVVDEHVGAGAAIQASKLQHEHRATVGEPTTTTLTTKDYPLFIARAAGTLISFEAAITGAIPVGVSTFTVDLKRSTGAAAFGSVLSATLSFTSASTLLLLSSATISTSTVADGDVFEAVVTVVGGGTQALGVVITATWKESTSQ